MNKARRFPIAMFGGDVDVVYAADYDKEVSDHNRLKEDTWALTQKLTADNERLREALEQISGWQSHTLPFAVDFGSNGVRDFYRNIARAALAGSKEGE